MVTAVCHGPLGSLETGSRLLGFVSGLWPRRLLAHEEKGFAVQCVEPRSVRHALSTVSMSLRDVCWSLKELAFKVLLDIGCMRSVVGVTWATEVIGRWRNEGRWQRVVEESEACRFGDGEVLYYSRYRIEFLGTFAGKEVVFGFSVVSGVCPPLFSRSACTQLGIVIDCEHHTLSSRRLGVKSFGMGRDEGHYTILCGLMSLRVRAQATSYHLTFSFLPPAGVDAMKLPTARCHHDFGACRARRPPRTAASRRCHDASCAMRPTTARRTARSLRW